MRRLIVLGCSMMLGALLGVFSPVQAQESLYNDQGALCVNVNYQFLRETESTSKLTGVSLPPEQSISSPDAVLMIFDVSGSMAEPIVGGTEIRMDVAQSVLTDYVQSFPEDGLIGMRLLGENECETSLVRPISALGDDRDDLIDQINSFTPTGSTPLAAAILAAQDDLAGFDGRREVVLVTDGEETCEGDPAAAALALASSDPNLQVSLNVVGFNILNDVPAQDNLREITRTSGGVFVTAEDGEDLLQALSLTERVPFFVTDAGGVSVIDSFANRGPTALNPDSYLVSIPALEIENQPVTVERGRGVSIDVAADGSVSVNENDGECISDFCPDVPLPRLSIGDRARVSPQDPRPLNIRDNPGTSANRILQIPILTEFEILDGPICRDGYLWWNIENDEFTGWAAEGVPGNYFMEPLTP